MILTNKQEEGLKIAIDRYKNREKYTVIGGYAGSGKSTLVKFIVAALSSYGVDPEEDVCYATFTGKASQVLLRKGNKNVSTLHKLLYRHIPKPDGGFIRIPEERLKYKIVIVDEVSMAPKNMMDLLFSHNVYVICLGDPFQLPPIDKNTDNHLLDKPHIFLDEIMRQAQESEIIRLSMDIRKENKIAYSKGSEVIVCEKKELNTGMLTWADQILVGTNQTRVNINNQMRTLLERGDRPENGDKVICLRNYWDEVSKEFNPLVNGTIGYIKDPSISNIHIPTYLGGGDYEILNANFTSDSGDDYGILKMDNKMILTGEKAIDYKQAFKMSKVTRYKELIPLEFTYGYAITTHKAQGSEWDDVLVLEEGFPFARTEHARWLYTAVTRAAERVVLVR